MISQQPYLNTSGSNHGFQAGYQNNINTGVYIKGIYNNSNMPQVLNLKAGNTLYNVLVRAWGM